MTAVTTWYTYPAQPLSPLIYLLWDSFVSMAKHMEFLLNYQILCSDTITCTSHMGLGTKHDSYNYWYSTKQCIKKRKTAISSITGGGGGGGGFVYGVNTWLLASKYPRQNTGTPQTWCTSFAIMHSYMCHT